MHPVAPLLVVLSLAAAGSGREDAVPAGVREAVRRHLAAGRRLSAYSLLVEHYEEAGREVPAEVLRALREAQEEFLAGRGGEFELYRVRPGETLWSIGRRWRVTPEFLMRVNGIADARRLAAGRRIRVVRGPFRAVVSLKARRLRVYLGRALVREYPVAVGAPDSPTPTGRFAVRGKVRNPRYDRGKEHYAPGDPRNPAGSRWMRLAGSFGIHGTNEPRSVGKAVSDGCLRLRNAHVEELFDFLVTGSPVLVQP